MWTWNSKSQPFYENIWVPDLPKQAHVLGRPLQLSIWHQRRRNHARRWQRRFQRRNVQKYLQVWVTDLDWVSRRDRGLSHVFCHVCNSQFSIAAASKQHPNIWTLIKFQVNNRATSFCVNPKIQEITRRVIIVSTRWTKRSPGGWLLCEPKGPGDHQAGDCSVNPQDQHITRGVIVVWTQRTKRSPGG